MFSSPVVSKKEQIEQYLRSRILDRCYAAGERLPSVRVLGSRFGVSVKIVSDALAVLETERLVRREAGRGVFVEHGRKLLFVFIGGDISAPYHYFSPGIEERAQELRLQIDCLPLAFIRSNATPELARRFAHEYFGIIYDGFYMRGDEPEVAFFAATGLPVVLPHANTGDNETTPFFVMHPDFRAAFSAIVRYLHAAGHRRLATLTFQKDDAFRGYTRDEYLELLRTLGCLRHEEYLVETPYGEAAIDAGIRRLMQLPDPPTALACTSDFFAMHAIKSLTALGFRIPDDVSVMGFCGYPGGNALTPPLTTIDLHFHEAGRTAVDLVCHAEKWLRLDAGHRVLITPHSIIERQSVKEPNVNQ